MDYDYKKDCKEWEEKHKSRGYDWREAQDMIPTLPRFLR